VRPKWLYVFSTATKEKRRYTLSTPSWAEALREALRERREDIPMLVESFIDRFARRAGKRIRRIKKTTMERLMSYPWPGNVRELQNVIERSLIVCETEDFTVDES